MQPQNNSKHEHAESTHSSQYFKDQEFTNQRISMDSKMDTVVENNEEGRFSIA